MTRQQQCAGVVKAVQLLAQRRECRFVLYAGRAVGAAL
jgi:hypothetical protein